MRLALVLGFVALLGVSWAGKETATGASRSVAELAADFERIMKRESEGIRANTKTKAEASGSGGSPPDSPGAPKSVAEIQYPLPPQATSPKTKDDDIREVLKKKQAELIKAKQTLLDLMNERDELFYKKMGRVNYWSDDVTYAIIRAIDLNVAYKP